MSWRDVVDVVGVMATVAATGLAWLAIRRGNKQAQDSANALVRERRLDFELDLLSELADQVESYPSVAMRDSKMKTRLQLLPAEDLPLCRTRFQLESTAEGREQRRRFQGPSGVAPEDWEDFGTGLTMRDAMREEIHEAIRRRLLERGSSSTDESTHALWTGFVFRLEWLRRRLAEGRWRREQGESAGARQ